MKLPYKQIIISLAVLAAPLAFTVPVSAHESIDDSQSTTNQQSKPRTAEEAQRLEAKKAEMLRQIELKKVEAQQKLTMLSEKKMEVRQKLDDAKRKVCANHQESLNKLMTRIVTQRQKQIAHIDEISTKVQAFYTKKGLTVENYDALVSDIEVKKAAATAAVAAAKPTSTFSCDGTGPKADLKAFHDKRDVAVDAIRDYRESVRKLITAVKSAQGVTSQEKTNE